MRQTVFFINNIVLEGAYKSILQISKTQVKSIKKLVCTVNMYIYVYSRLCLENLFVWHYYGNLGFFFSLFIHLSVTSVNFVCMHQVGGWSIYVCKCDWRFIYIRQTVYAGIIYRSVYRCAMGMSTYTYHI